MIYDELDLPLGTIRIRQRGSSAGHNGMESILGALGTDEFLRIRLGIAPERKVADGVKYVLTPFRKAQEKVVDEILDTAAQAVEVILKEGPAAAMNRFNRKNEADETVVSWSVVSWSWQDRTGSRMNSRTTDTTVH